MGAVVAIDSYGSGTRGPGIDADEVVAFFENITGGGPVNQLLRRVDRRDPLEDSTEDLTVSQDRLIEAGLLVEPLEPTQLLTLFRVHRANARALANFAKLDTIDPPTLAIAAQNATTFPQLVRHSEGREMRTISDTDHYSIMAEPARQQLSQMISDHLRELTPRRKS